MSMTKNSSEVTGNFLICRSWTNSLFVFCLAGPHTLSTPAKWRVASVGTDMDGARTVLADKDAEGNGEVRLLTKLTFPFTVLHCTDK